MISRRQWKRWWRNLRDWRWFLRAWLLEDRALEGLGGPPNNWRSLYDVRGKHDNVSYTCSFNNDAHEIWFWQEFDEEDGRWAFFLDAGAFRRMALWYVWRWAWGEWFGLRRRLFYWDNHRRVQQMRSAVEREEKI